MKIEPLTEDPAPLPEAGLGALRTERGNLPLESVDVRAAVTGLSARIAVVQGFTNPYDVPLEATYVFPLPDRAAVTAMRMEADDRVIEGVLKERGQARQDYATAVAEGRRAALAEEERPDVFTMTVGNILPGERVTVRLTLSQPLPYEDGEATLRFPLVVAPRYVPGTPLDGGPAGGGAAPDTDAAPDASRISPPVLLPGFPNPVRLSLSVDLDPAGLALGAVRSSLHTVTTDGRTLRLEPGERLDRDFVLRLRYETGASYVVSGETFTVTVLPPDGDARRRPRDVVILLDRSGSMGGWKMVAARRAAARIVDTLTGTAGSGATRPVPGMTAGEPSDGRPPADGADAGPATGVPGFAEEMGRPPGPEPVAAGDRFAVLSFDHVMEYALPGGLVPATDRNRYRAVEHLARLEARGGTEMLRPLQEGVGLLSASPPDRDRVLVLVTDGQVANEDQILQRLSLDGIRVHTVGIDRAVNAGFLGRLAAAGAGRCELVESEDRLDEVMDHIHRRIAAPLVTGVSVDLPSAVPGTLAPSRPGDLFPGVPLVVRGRCASAEPVAVRGVAADGSPWERRLEPVRTEDPSAAAIWARAHLRELEDRWAARAAEPGLAERIVETSLRYGVLCRFTAFVAVDSRVVAEGAPSHRVVQPVEQPSGWAGGPAVPGGPVPRAGAVPAPGASGAPAETAGPAFLGRFVEDSFAPEGAMPAGAVPPPVAAPPPAAPPPAVPPAAPGGGPARGFHPRRMTVRAGRAGASEADVRAVAAEELRRLRAARPATEAERRQILADLGSRLHVLLPGELTDLVAALRSCDDPAGPRGRDLDELWDRALRELAAFGDPPPPADREPFWRRRPS